MKKAAILFIAMLCALAPAGCAQAESGGMPASGAATPAAGVPPVPEDREAGAVSLSPGTDETGMPDTPAPPGTSTETESSEWEETDMINLQIGEYTLRAELADNSSARAFAELLAQGPVTVQMHDYGGMEKVGALPASLPENNAQITTEPGDLILYQGNSITVYYDTNSWTLTRLGKVQDVTRQELKDILGEGNVEVTFSL